MKRVSSDGFRWHQIRICQDQRGSEHLVSFRLSALTRPVWVPANSPAFETFASIADEYHDDVADYADNGELPLILDESGNIYMESARVTE